MNLGVIIAEIRQLRGLNQGQLAKLVGFSQAFICLIEGGKREPSLEGLGKIAEGLDIPMGFLMMLADDSKHPIVEKTKVKIRRILSESV